MNQRALGKGLASLLPGMLLSKSAPEIVEEGASRYLECPINDIIPSKDQPRKLFEKKGLEELALSIREKGVIEPLLVRAMPGGKYELIAGERRLRASKLANLDKVPVVIFDCEDDEVMEIALIENIQRQDLNPIEEALAYKNLLERYDYTQDQLAERVGKDRSTIANAIRLLGLPEEIRGDIIENRLSMGHARALLALDDDALKIKVKNQIIKDQLSVREVENLIRDLRNGLQLRKVAVAKIEDPQIKFIENEMMKILGTKVKIKPSGKKGKVLIDYYTHEDLDRIYNAVIG